MQYIASMSASIHDNYAILSRRHLKPTWKKFNKLLKSGRFDKVVKTFIL